MKGKSYRSWKSFGASLHFGNPHPNNPSAQEDAFALPRWKVSIAAGVNNSKNTKFFNVRNLGK
jgi:hypothetical protein